MVLGKWKMKLQLPVYRNWEVGIWRNQLLGRLLTELKGLSIKNQVKELQMNFDDSKI